VGERLIWKSCDEVPEQAPARGEAHREQADADGSWNWQMLTTTDADRCGNHASMHCATSDPRTENHANLTLCKLW
jgi:hypothetical protein